MTTKAHSRLSRRALLKLIGGAVIGYRVGWAEEEFPMKNADIAPGKSGESLSDRADSVTLFLCGDVMTGRGIDQVLPHPSHPRIHEPFLQSAQGYVELAETVNGSIKRPVDFAYIWGDALKEFTLKKPDVRIINFETAVTRSDDYWRGKGINYRMHPDNIPCITAAAIDCCTLANNHVLDWGYSGLDETLDTLRTAKIQTTGAGANLNEAQAPAIMPLTGDARVVVFSFGAQSSGIPVAWAATKSREGINLLPDLSTRTLRNIAALVQKYKKPHDIVVASLHWGGNWGYAIPAEHVRFAHGLIEAAGIDIVHGHSSHHVKGIEVFKGKPILYGCGDFLNDYEGIGGYESFRDDLTLMYFVTMDPTRGQLLRLEMTAMQIRRFRVNYASTADARWLAAVLSREGDRFGTEVKHEDTHYSSLTWS